MSHTTPVSKIISHFVFLSSNLQKHILIQRFDTVAILLPSPSSIPSTSARTCNRSSLDPSLCFLIVPIFLHGLFEYVFTTDDPEDSPEKDIAHT
mmetsp:Transcript_6634/g.9726  ORF Transcript_6634/g.9726 Transcript_6634/m.9726 type:complete len:94 (+) Transcript_6634:160-441(+)